MKRLSAGIVAIVVICMHEMGKEKLNQTIACT